MKTPIAFLLVLLFMVSCSQKEKSAQTEPAYKKEVTSQVEDISKLKDAVEQTELAFSKMAGEKGITEAFYHFADDNAVLMRRNSLVKGKEAIKEFYLQSGLDNAKLEWAPSFVDVASSGDMAYTYGNYNLTMQDSTGETQSASGIFHTVWKRQEDGSWKYVWD
jgi:ketosteroid isomerase-like protein